MKHNWSNGDEDDATSGDSVHCLRCGTGCTTMNESSECPADPPRVRQPGFLDSPATVGERLKSIQAAEARTGSTPKTTPLEIDFSIFGTTPIQQFTFSECAEFLRKFSKQEEFSQMNPIVYPIVGSFYRPPAKSILESIPVRTPLELRAEPSNTVDPNAIAVWIKTADIPEPAHKVLALHGADCGFHIGVDPSESPEAFVSAILLSPAWHLGYIPAMIAKTIKLRAGSAPGKLLITNGKYQILLDSELSIEHI